jgi:hypothetical protein
VANYESPKLEPDVRFIHALPKDYMIKEQNTCDGPLKQIGLTDKGIPIWYCETCKKETYGYNHRRDSE